jgi:hypothetical protein
VLLHLNLDMLCRFARIVLPLILLLFLAACSSFAKGVTEAILESSERKDTRQCHIEGPPSVGLVHFLESQNQGSVGGTRELKVLMIHGIGRHLSGYSRRLTESLMPALGLTIKTNTRKEIVLWEPTVSADPVGRLSVDLYMSPDRARRLVFYELTWSEVFEEERRSLAFDNSKEYAIRRTELNGFLKRFFSDRVPDVFIYLSDARAKIFASVQQSFCWMTSGDWEDLPNRASKRCKHLNEERVRFARQDDFAFLTHSLGSRIVIDVLQDETGLVYRPEGNTSQALAEVFREREVPIYMLGNQIPLLGLSIEPPSVQEQTDAHCTPEGALADQRAFKKLSIYVFSDPNDLLSYPIPPNLVHRYVDSRLCPSVTNISINVTQPIDFFGISEFVNPVAAHSDYDHDERVIEIIAHGVGHAGISPLLEERCSWMKTVEND